MIALHPTTALHPATALHPVTGLYPHDLERPDATIRYWSGGSTPAPTIVLLHGATLDHRAWAPQIDALQDRFQLVVPDLRAHGSSSGTFEFEAAVTDTVALLDELPARRVVLVGLSLGANIAQEVVRRRPDLVEALVVSDATCNTAARHPLAVPMTIGLLNAQAMLPGDGFARLAVNSTALDPDVRAYAAQANAHRSNRETVAILTELLSGALRPQPDYRTPVPLLLIRGERDQVGDIAAGTAAWAGREPLAEYAVIPEAGHTSNLDNPQAFNEVLTAFLDRIVPPRRLVAERPAADRSPEPDHPRGLHRLLRAEMGRAA
jgi:3-oxoadipate enol-lactonase